MADRTTPIANLTSISYVTGVDLLIVQVDPSNTNLTRVVTVNNFFNNSSFNVTANSLNIRKSDTPANSTPTVTRGTMWFDADYIYCATSNNVVKRVALTSF